MEIRNQVDKTAYGRKWLFPLLFSFLFAICMVFGRELDKNGCVSFRSPVMWLLILLLTVIGRLLLCWLWGLLYRLEKSKGGRVEVTEAKKENRPVTARSLALYGVIIFICYLPVFLAVYPGFFVYDAQDELMQVITRTFSTHHPLLHVLLLGGIIQLVHKLSGSYNVGIACYTLFQMAALSCIFSFGIYQLKKEGMGKKGCLLAALYLGLFPTVVMFSLCSAKDGLFTGMLLLIVLMLRELVREPEAFFQKKVHMFLLLGAGVLMMLLRHNGFYAFLVFAVMFLLLRKVTGLRGCLKKLFFLFVGIVVIYLAVNKGLALALNAQDSEHQEILTVPIQQMARVYAMEGDTLSNEDKNTLYEILPEEALKRYTPKVSDPVKISFCNEAYEAQPGRYLKLWLKIGREHPFAYLNAWFMTSYGFWYPNTVIDVYRGNTVFTFTYEDSSYFGYEVEQPGERHSLIPALNEFYRRLSLEPKVQQLPVISWLFSPGFLFWLTAFVLGYFLYAGHDKKLIPYLLPLLIWLTVTLGPTYLVRYVIFLWILMPVLLWDMVHLFQSGDV